MTSDAAILAALYRADGGFVSVTELEHALAMSPDTSLLVCLNQLKGLGYGIEFNPHQGYRLAEIPDRLVADDLRARLGDCAIGSEIVVFETTTSTNDVVERLARSGKPEGVVVFAEAQTKGRGRQGRAWASPRGRGLWFSVLLRPPLETTQMPRITVAASVALARALRKHATLDVRIKWPNDILIGPRKLAGILTELRGDAAVLGIGINVNGTVDQFPDELKPIATSIEIETGRVQDRVQLATEILRELNTVYAMVASDFDAITEEWARLSNTLGRQLVVTHGGSRLSGLAHALDESGALLLRKDSGQVIRITGGDVAVVG